MSTFGGLDGDLRWFCARMKAMAPDSDIPHDVGGLTDEEYAFFDEEHNINYTLLRLSGIFRIEVEVTLPPVGGEALWNMQMLRFRMRSENIGFPISVESNICLNGQIGMLELRMSKANATVENIELLRLCIVTGVCCNLVSYCDRYVGVKYDETGHLFYAHLHRFDICRALLIREKSIETYSREIGEVDSASNSEEMTVCMDMNHIDMIEPRNLIPEETFRRVWERYVSAADIRRCN